MCRCRRLRRSYNAFIASLSATDLLFNVTIMPFYIDSFFQRGWRHSCSICRFQTFFGSMVLMTSALHIGLIATNRYVLIVQPKWYPRLSSNGALVGQVCIIISGVEFFFYLSLFGSILLR